MIRLIPIARVGILVALFVLSCTLQASAQITAGVRGKATGLNGEILVDHQIIIKNNAIDHSYKVKTNKRGEYVYIGLPAGSYQIELWSPAGAKLFGIGTRLGSGHKQVDFDLAKERKDEESSPEYVATKKKQDEAQAKDKKEFTSLTEYFNAGNLYVQQKNYDEAITHFEAALKIAKLRNIPVIVARIADTYAAAGKYEEAEKSYKQAIELRPEAALTHSNFALALAKMGRVDEARAEFDKASELNPETAAANYFNLGAILYNQGTQMEEAEAAFKKCLELNPKHADAHFLTAQAMMGKLTLDAETGTTVLPEGLIEALQTYLELEPEGKYAGSAKMLIQTMAGTIETNFKAAPRRRRSRN